MRIILLLGVFWANNLFAQKASYQLDTIISYPFPSLPFAGKLDYNLKAVLDRDEIIFIRKADEKSLVSHIYSLQLNNYRLDSLSIAGAEKYHIERETWLDASVGPNGSLFLLTDLNLYEFHKTVDQYKVARIHEYEGAYRYLGTLSASTLFLGEMYNHGLEQGYKARLSTLSLNKGAEYDYFPQVNHIGLTHMGVYKRMACRNGKVYYIDLNAYQVYETDSHFSVLRTIIKEEKKGWMYLKPQAANDINALGDDGFGIITYIKDAGVKYSHLNHIGFLNDTSMLLGYTNYDKKNRALKFWDVWTCNASGNWKISLSGISDNSTAKSKFTKENSPLELVGNITLTGSDKIVRITYSSGLSPLGLSQKEFSDKIDQYYEKNSARLVFTVFKHSFVK